MPKMRFAAYAAVSTLLATGVVVKAFRERPNFYSACVQLSQDNTSLGILINLSLLALFSFMRGMQRIFYGPLRPIEREQLYEKAWFTITETCLAMTVFRDEIGGWFLVMFVSLLVGKVWDWIGEGRVEFLEQQPPANPRMAHLRLASSLILSVLFDTFLLHFSVISVLEEAKPGMMVMFGFEFAVMTLTSFSHLLRYIIAARDAWITYSQTQATLATRRAEARTAREEAIARAEAARASGSDEEVVIPPEEDIDEQEIDVPGWEEKGRWVFALDLMTDFTKLLVYIGFFAVLMVFHGLPIHIIRDLYITMRSFLRRIHDFVQYRNATKDMHTRYPDATTEELATDNTCIICREEMTAWREPQAGANPATPQEERLRPKKLPCGHILHFSCLRSWLERQQACPTCRRPVLGEAVNRTRPGQAGNAPAANGANQPAPAGGDAPAQPRQDLPRVERRRQPAERALHIGPWRITFGFQRGQQQPPTYEVIQNIQANQRAITGQPALGGPPPIHSALAQLQLLQMERQLNHEIDQLTLTQTQLAYVRALQAELARLRALQSPSHPHVATYSDPALNAPTASGLLPPSARLLGARTPPPPGVGNFGAPPNLASPGILANDHAQQPLEASNSALPEGMTLPEGWSIIPLNRIGDGTSSSPNTIPGPPPAVPGAAGSMPTINLPTPTFQFSIPSGQPPVPQASAVPNADMPSSLGATQSPTTSNPPSSSQPTVDSSSTATSAPVMPSSPLPGPLSPQPRTAGQASILSQAASSPAPTEPSVPAAGVDSTLLAPGGDWNFAAAPASDEAATKTTDAAPGIAQASETAGEAANGMSEVARGKARAATVEEAEDPDA
ncbi:hypothetical protein K402DRAFT_452914 [Aulographum hederae CBS 113979]|uniref:RING-type E3 ubiquitin transferase n=1 Tax=Aulographum hederae CBS 113979 TaxID=1176131 RepID=A0A6G1H5A8_9PEZI|nr:hypothetical protein K402DRAFT_452914 [Aulographum hederae CBS 113979]